LKSGFASFLGMERFERGRGEKLSLLVYFCGVFASGAFLVEELFLLLGGFSIDFDLEFGFKVFLWEL